MSRKKVAILISGSGSNMLALIRAAATPGYPAEIVAVISNVATALGLERADNEHIPIHVLAHQDFPSREEYDEALHALIVSTGAEIICLAGFMRLLSTGFVEKWQGRLLNIHPSLLPAFRGLHTHRQALEAGVAISGCTVHFVIPELDAGPAIIQAAVPVLPKDTEKTLGSRVLQAEHRIYPAALLGVASGSVSLNEEGRVLHTAIAGKDTPLLFWPPLGA